MVKLKFYSLVRNFVTAKTGVECINSYGENFGGALSKVWSLHLKCKWLSPYSCLGSLMQARSCYTHMFNCPYVVLLT